MLKRIFGWGMVVAVVILTTGFFSSQQKSITFTVSKKEDSTWGYCIFKDGKLTIRQENIPGLMGTKGFVYSEDAVKVAKWVIQKINRDEFPPSISQEEMKNLDLKQFTSEGQ